MRSEFYSGKYTLICEDKNLNSKFPELDIYNAGIEQACLQIKENEINNEFFYSGHFIINNRDTLTQVRGLLNHLLRGNYIPKRNVVVPEITHHGVDSKCTLDSGFIYCSSWALPIVVGTSRTPNNIYGNTLRHRLKLYTPQNILKAL